MMTGRNGSNAAIFTVIVETELLGGRWQTVYCQHSIDRDNYEVINDGQDVNLGYQNLPLKTGRSEINLECSEENYSSHQRLGNFQMQ